jgi:hypothetical protein
MITDKYVCMLIRLTIGLITNSIILAAMCELGHRKYK